MPGRGHVERLVSGWDDLGDDELRARLVQRGVDPVSAGLMASAREDLYVAEQIAGVLGDG